MTTAPLLVRAARVVTRRGAGDPVDLRIADGVVRSVAPGRSLRPEPGETVLDAAGRWAVPGLWDHHVHLDQWAVTRRRLPLHATRSAADVVAAAARHIATLPDDDSPVEGYGFRAATWHDRATVAALDAVSRRHPVVLVSGDAHAGWLNSAALARLGLPPTHGPLEENEWFPLFARLGELTDASTPDPTEAVRAAVRDANARGVVGLTDLEFAAPWDRWPAYVAAGIDSVRVRAGVYPDRLDEAIARGLRTGDPLGGPGSPAAVGPLKVITDGSLGTLTAHCHDPYLDPATGPLAQPRGTQNVSPDELRGLLGTAVDRGYEVALHAIGDAAVGIALDAVAATGAHVGLEHAQLVRADDVARMRLLGLRASVQPAHLVDDALVMDRLWADRTGRCFPLRSLADAGVPLALGSDAPVSRLDPWLAMAAAVERPTSPDDLTPWHPEQALTPAEALFASTDGAGPIGPGSRGDIVLVEHDPLTSPLLGVRVATTVVDGRVVHDAR